MVSLGTLLKTPSVTQALTRIEGEQSELVDRLIKWSRINSGSRNLAGLARMEAEIVDAARPLGAEVDFIDLPPTKAVDAGGNEVRHENGRMIQLVKRPEANRKILLTGHTDTVFAKEDPFQNVVWQDETILNGPGVADMKGGILVMLAALKAFEKTEFAAHVGWEVLLSPDEETGSLASGPVLMERAKTAHIGMTYEPALPDGTLAGERKGSGNFTVVVTGREAHAGRSFFDGRNAIMHLSALMNELAALTDSRPDLTLNIAEVSGGKAPNIVPGKALCRFNVRLKAASDEVYILERLHEIVAKYDAADGYSAALYGGINRPPKVISPAGQKLMDLVAECGAGLNIPVSYVATGGCCEGNNLAAAGLPNVDTLGVRGAYIHSAGEIMYADSLTERAKLSLLVMTAFAAGLLDEVLIVGEA